MSIGTDYKTISIEIPCEVHLYVKTMAAKHSKKMQDVYIHLLRTGENTKRAGDKKWRM